MAFIMAQRRVMRGSGEVNAEVKKFRSMYVIRK